MIVIEEGGDVGCEFFVVGDLDDDIVEDAVFAEEVPEDDGVDEVGIFEVDLDPLESWGIEDDRVAWIAVDFTVGDPVEGALQGWIGVAGGDWFI